MKILNHHHRQLNKIRNNHLRSNHEKMQSSNFIHERNKHKQSNRSIRDNNNLLNVKYNLDIDEQKTSLLKINHENHDLFR